MLYLFLIFLVLVFLLIYASSRSNRGMKRYSSNEWIKAGGVLGAAILVARFVKLPLATIITALPFILPYLKQAENVQQQTSSAMTREEAALILGVARNASPEQVKEAHRRLITKNHPDTGGSDYLAAKINQARDVLLG